MKLRNVALVGMFFSLLVITGCQGEESKARNMEQIYKEEGVPVRVKTVKKGDFFIEHSYNSVLTGIEETSAFAAFGDRVEKIYVKVGDYVKKDQVLLSFPMDSPSAKYRQAKVAFENSEKNLKRYENLFKTGGISKQTLDNIKTQFEVDKANWEAVRQTVKVKAPISGYVTKVNVRETENVDNKQMLFTIANLSKLKARINITEDEIDDIKVGETAFAISNGKKIEGKVVQVDLSMNPYTQAFGAVVEFDNKSKDLRAGITANIVIMISANEGSIIVERKNILKEDNNYFAYVINSQKAEKRAVKIGKSRELFVEVTNGLSEGDMLVTEGQLLLENGSKIKIVK